MSPRAKNEPSSRGSLSGAERHYRAVLDAAADAILIAELDGGRFVDANPAACELLGYSLAELKRLTDRMLHAAEDGAEVATLSATLSETAKAHHPGVRLQRKDGSVFWGELRMGAYQVDDDKLYVTIIRDISQRVERERDLGASYLALRETQAQLVQAGKLSALGQLGAGIAHELNQPLTAIQGFAERLRGSGVSRQQRDELDIIIKESRRMAAIVDNIRAFGRTAGLELEPIDALAPLDDALTLVGQQLSSRGIVLEREVEAGLPRVLGDGTRLQQVYLNLLINARDALDDLSTAEKRIAVTARRAGDTVRVALQNNGAAIPPGEVDHLFEPFYTTKEGGTGLGLSISYGILREHGGTLSHEAPEGDGARFVLALQVAPS